MISAEVIGQERVYLALDRVAAGAVDFTRTKDEIGTALRSQTKARIDGGGYVPLSADYAKRKAKTFPGQPVLRATDRLYRSLTGAGAEGAILTAQPSELTFGTSVPYGVYLQVGTSRMPARPPLALTPENAAAVLGIIKTDAAKFAGGLGFGVQA